jgi:type I restriction enzyme R subunit
MSPAHPTEQRFEDHITDHLVACGYTQRLPSSYDKDLCLIPEDVIAFVQATQPDQWQQLERQYGTAKETERRLCERLQSQIERKGTLEILRKGIEI